jgi:tetratricopeptide (TPR) repeat protein
MHVTHCYVCNRPSGFARRLGFGTFFTIFLFAWIVSASAQNTVSFDNQSGEPALVKLIGPTSSEIEVPDGTKQSVQASAGKYFIKVRYGVQGKYRYTKGQEFTVDETATTKSTITITLHKVVNGNYGSSPITEREFGVGDLVTQQGTAAEVKSVKDQGNAPSGFDTSLLEAARTGDTAAVQQLLRKGANVNAARNDGVTPLYAASHEGHADAVKLLLAAGANVNAAANGGFTPLMAASEQGHADVVQLLKAAGASPTTVEAYRKAADQDYAEVYSNRGDAKIRKGDLDGAIADYNKAIELKPDLAVAYYNRGTAKRAKGDLDGAIADYNKGIELKPDLAVAYYIRGAAKEIKGDIDGAIADCNKAIQLKPDFAKAYFNRGLAKQAKGDLDGAIKDYNEAIQLKPDLAEAYGDRGAAKGAKGDLDGAIADCNKAIQLKPDFAEAYFNRGLAKKAKGDIDGANSDHAKAIELKPGAYR